MHIGHNITPLFQLDKKMKINNKISQKAQRTPPFYVMEVMERAQELERSGIDIIHFEVGEPDYPTAPHICEAACSAIRSGKTKYTHSLGLRELREAVAESYNQKFGTDKEILLDLLQGPDVLGRSNKISQPPSCHGIQF